MNSFLFVKNAQNTTYIGFHCLADLFAEVINSLLELQSPSPYLVVIFYRIRRIQKLHKLLYTRTFCFHDRWQWGVRIIFLREIEKLGAQLG